jgi:SAM-dependent methyltransferase
MSICLFEFAKLVIPYPAKGCLKIFSNFETTFDAAADYEKIRPAYLPEIFDDILRYKPIVTSSSVLEIGMGTGVATKPFLDTGCRFTGVEPGVNLARIASDKYRGCENFSICAQSFQDFDCPDASFDLIYAATAFHWIPEEYGYRRVYALLKDGGAFARFRYHAGTDKGREALTEEMQALYRKYMQRGRPAEFTESDAKAIADTAVSYGFIDTQYKLYRATKDFTADEYIMLLKTYPDHMKLAEPDRTKLFEGIHRAIIAHGGTIRVYYTMDLELARKPRS